TCASHLEHSVDFSLTGLWRRKCLFGERCGLRLAVARRFEPFAARCREFALSILQVGSEHGIGVQYSDGCSSHETTLNHVALPMNVADHTALPESSAPGEDSIGPSGGNLTEDERPRPTDRCVPRRIRTILPQRVFGKRGADGPPVHNERTSAHVVIFRQVG